jgi:hypothetical protein
LHDGFAAAAAEHERVANRYSLVRLVSFVTAAALITSGIMQHAMVSVVGGAALLVGFGVAVVLHARAIAARAGALSRQAIHARHLLRLGSGWTQLTSRGEGLLRPDHPYAGDVDLLGQASLFQRIDVTHTRQGERTLAHWLGEAAPADVIAERQAAVAELAAALQLRQELEAAAAVQDEQKLDARGLDALAQLPPVFASRPLLRVLVFALPGSTLVAYVGGSVGAWHAALWLLPAACQVGLLMAFGAQIRRGLDVVSAKLPVLESFERMLVLVERAQWQAPLLRQMQQTVAFGDRPPSVHMRRLSRWAGFAELRQNFLFHVVVNTLTLWDLHVLWGIERFVRDVGSRTDQWLRVLGELESLASLATLAHGDPAASFPEIAPSSAAFEATGLGHPLLCPAQRVPNDVALRGPGSALVVTGSNMAGKSTLLRAVGQNIALALCGGPVIAERLRVPALRLRASMRAQDSLESGASYFHAELEKLRGVIENASAEPPVFFLLDELLRGTNARARHLGAKAVLLHLLDRHATGLCATHDVELAALGNEQPERIANVHFTDVIVDGEMRFDYKLRTGIVRTSNALRLLAMVGIDVPRHEREALEGPELGEPTSASSAATAATPAQAAKGAL